MNDNFLKNCYNRDDFLAFIKWFIPDFVEEHAVINPEHEIFQEILVLGKGLKNELAVIEIKTRKVKNNERISITKEAFRIMFKRGISQAIICFHAGGKSWRMSLLTTSSQFKDGKIKREISNPHRYSYYLGEKAKTRTPHKIIVEKGPVDCLEDLKSRFSIEVVNQEFYSNISDLFLILAGGDTGKQKFPGTIKITGVDNGSQNIKEFAVRLIGRIIFCWFLKEKKSDNGTALIPEELLSVDAVKKCTSNYYHDFLEPLFFETLNTPYTKRHNRFTASPFKDIPYLNGGLFSPLAGDHYRYSDDAETGSYGELTIDNEWFKKLFELLSLYNFTVDENTPYDIDLSIDPEMLGRIFENLLAEINTETGDAARKNTGSFYTPREIVEYMVDRSLIEYLSFNTGIIKEKISKLVSYSANDDELMELDDTEKDKIISKLKTITILDPACGSGAFPIGMLQKIVYVLQTIDPDARLWLEAQLENASPELERFFKEKYNAGSYDYLRKLGVIRESIFGIDIQTIAVEITRLRCFLTLIVDEPIDDNEKNRGIQPLPNLDFKFVAANSLLPLNGTENTKRVQTSMMENWSHIEELQRIRNQYFGATELERQELKIEFLSLQRKMSNNAYDVYKEAATDRYKKLMHWDPFEHATTDWFDPEWMFGVKSFDLVIANPPYIHLEKIKDKPEHKLYQEYYKETFKSRGDIYACFFEFGIRCLKENGFLTYITSNKWMRAEYGLPLRNFFLNNTNPIQLVDLGGGVFNSATVDTDILITQKRENQHELKAVSLDSASREDMTSYILENSTSMHYAIDESWAILSPIELSIKKKIEAAGTPLGEWDISINYGIKTGCNEAFIVTEEQRAKILSECNDEDERQRTDELIRPILRGRDIGRYSYSFADLYVILAYYGSYKVLPNLYPAIYNHLKKYEDKLKNRGQVKGTSSGKVNLEADFPGQHHWLELDNNPSKKYLDDFSKPKIAWSETNDAHNTKIVKIDEPFYTDKTCFIATSNNQKIIDHVYKVMSSNIFTWYSLFNSPRLGSSGISLTKDSVKNFPISLDMTPNNDAYKCYNLTQDEIDYINNSLF